jgi:Tol biopolymer transport system component
MVLAFPGSGEVLAAGFKRSKVTTMRSLCFIVSFLTIGTGFSQTSENRPSSCTGCFSEPQSTLLFSGENGDLNLVTPSWNLTVPHLPKWAEQHASPLPAISPSGDRIAWSLKFMLNADLVKCDPSKKGWCDPKPKPIFKSVMGVYSVRDKTWEQYGDFEEVGSAAFSPDGNEVAFEMNRGCTVFRCDEGLMILDLQTGQITPVPGSASVVGIKQLSWSPDGKSLAGNGGYGDRDHIVLIDLATGEMKTIAEGSDPSWSPKGDWIAYRVTVHCMIVHPDGTGARSVFEKERKWMNYTLDTPIVWSPDGEKLLLNQRQIEGYRNRVIMVDLDSGHAVRISKNGEYVLGWVPYSGN